MVPGILEVALAQKGALVRIFRHAISLFTVIFRRFPVSCVAERRNISALWIFSRPLRLSRNPSGSLFRGIAADSS